MSEDGASDHSLLIRLLESVAELRGEFRAFNDRTKGLESDVAGVTVRVESLEVRQESYVTTDDLTKLEVSRKEAVDQALAAADRKANFRLGTIAVVVAAVNVGIAVIR